MKKIWFGEIPDVFGYGITCLGNSKKEVMDTLKKEYKQWKEYAPDEETSFKASFEYYDARVYQVKLGKGYHEGFREQSLLVSPRNGGERRMDSGSRQGILQTAAQP